MTSGQRAGREQEQDDEEELHALHHVAELRGAVTVSEMIITRKIFWIFLKPQRKIGYFLKADIGKSI